MDLKQLEYFTSVVKEGNISKAAKKLHLSQPPLSMQIKNLEAELGVNLFERGARKIELSEAGKLLYSRATSILELSEITKEELLSLNTKTYGTIRLGVVSSIGSTYVSKEVKSFHEIYPDINFELFEANTYEQLELLKNKEIELALVRSPFEENQATSIVLKTEPMMAVAHKHFFLKDSPQVTLFDLKNQPLILYRRWEAILTQLFAKDNIPYHIFCKNDDAKTTVRWAQEGLGIAILPLSACGLISTKDTVYKKIADTRLTSHICLVYNKNHSFSSIANLFVQHMTRHI